MSALPQRRALFFGFSSGEIISPTGQAIGTATVIVKSKGAIAHCSLSLTVAFALGQPGYVVVDDNSDTCNNVPPNAFAFTETDRGGYSCHDINSPCPKKKVAVYSQEGELWGTFTTDG